MAAVYFDTSVFLAILGGKPEAKAVRGLLRELTADKVRIVTSIITVQEVSVQSFSRGSMFTDNHSKVAKLARIKGISKEIALTAAKYEAEIIAAGKASATPDHKIEENRRRKFDCFHLATAVAHSCNVLYAFDGKFQGRCSLLGLTMRVEVPQARRPGLLDSLADGSISLGAE
jgi:predicted nucleic acid-binding protein